MELNLITTINSEYEFLKFVFLKMQLENQFPYQFKIGTDMEGEVWKDIPGFEGTYQASTLGRIKSLDRIIDHPRLKQQLVAGRILSQSVAKNYNKTTGDATIDLRVTLTIENRAHYFNVKRLIYLTFIDSHLNFKENGKCVINKDGNGYNNHIDNLQLVTKSEKQRRVFLNGRGSNYLKTADRGKWPKNYGSYLIKLNVNNLNLKHMFYFLN